MRAIVSGVLISLLVACAARAQPKADGGATATPTRSASNAGGAQPKADGGPPATPTPTPGPAGRASARDGAAPDGAPGASARDTDASARSPCEARPGGAAAASRLSPLRDRFLVWTGRHPNVCGHADVRVSGSVVDSIEHLIDVSERIAKNFPAQAAEWRARAERHLSAAENGQDLYGSLRGQIASRGYRSPISRRVQGYTIYVPPDYTAEKKWPLMVVLHGGSSNGNLFLGVVLGNNMDWKSYDKHLWDKYEPRWSPPFIVVAPDGYGQVLWRWMGEQDVLDVIADVQRNYSVDDERIVLSGLSNGGVGAYAIGSRHAYRFSVVQAIAGAPSWIQYAGEGSVGDVEAKLMRPWSALDLLENWHNGDVRYFHGTVDPGPMKPAYVRELDKRVAAQSIPARGKWFETGHDLLYLVHRHGKVYDELVDERRATRPREVRLVTGDFRAARQHWLEITRFARYPELARVRASCDGAKLTIQSENSTALVVHVPELPAGETLQVEVDGTKVYAGPRAKLGPRLELVKGDSWQRGAAPTGLVKRPGSSGPMTDAYYDRMVHVYGTLRPENSAALRQVAEKAARGLPLWLWSVEQEVVADTDVSPELIKSAHVVLYGTPGDNAILDRLAPKLPIRVEPTGVRLGERLVNERGVGVRFIYPNPEAPERYIIVQSAPTLDGVKRGLNLPDFVPDWVVYDANSAASRPRLVPSKRAPLRGFFGANWELVTP